ncbi:hypothetical protein ACHAQA_008837 [Verticillium albo-atrum]
MPARKPKNRNNDRYRGSERLANKYRKQRMWQTFESDWKAFRLYPDGTKTWFKFPSIPLRLTIKPHVEEAQIAVQTANGRQIEVYDDLVAKEWRLFLLLSRLAKARSKRAVHLGDGPLDSSIIRHSRTKYPGSTKTIWATGHATVKTLRLFRKALNARRRARNDRAQRNDRGKKGSLKKRKNKY